MFDKTLFNVTKTSQITGMHPQTLRHYEKIGLVVPRRTLGGVRRYSSRDIERLKAIRVLCNQGVNLEGVAIILRQQEEISILKAQIRAQKEGAIFLGSEDGQVDITQISKFQEMSFWERLKLWRAIKQRSKMMLKKPPLQITSGE